MHTKLSILNKLSIIWQPFFFQINTKCIGKPSSTVSSFPSVPFVPYTLQVDCAWLLVCICRSHAISATSWCLHSIILDATSVRILNTNARNFLLRYFSTGGESLTVYFSSSPPNRCLYSRTMFLYSDTDFYLLVFLLLLLLLPPPPLLSSWWNAISKSIELSSFHWKIMEEKVWINFAFRFCCRYDLAISHKDVEWFEYSWVKKNSIKKESN